SHALAARTRPCARRTRRATGRDRPGRWRTIPALRAAPPTAKPALRCARHGSLRAAPGAPPGVEWPANLSVTAKHEIHQRAHALRDLLFDRVDTDPEPLRGFA